MANSECLSPLQFKEANKYQLEFSHPTTNGNDFTVILLIKKLSQDSQAIEAVNGASSPNSRHWPHFLYQSSLDKASVTWQIPVRLSKRRVHINLRSFRTVHFPNFCTTCQPADFLAVEQWHRLRAWADETEVTDRVFTGFTSNLNWNNKNPTASSPLKKCQTFFWGSTAGGQSLTSKAKLLALANFATPPPVPPNPLTSLL